jgi:hypothetical protein
MRLEFWRRTPHHQKDLINFRKAGSFSALKVGLRQIYAPEKTATML